MSMMGQERKLPPQQAQMLKETLNRDYIAVALNRDKLDAQFVGMSDFDGEKFAKVSININDKDITYLINPGTGLPRLMRYKQFNPQAGKQVQVEERFTDWKSSGGVNYAYTQTSYVDGKKNAETTNKMHAVNK
jgi:hypothetical protein